MGQADPNGPILQTLNGDAAKPLFYDPLRAKPLSKLVDAAAPARKQSRRAGPAPSPASTPSPASSPGPAAQTMRSFMAAGPSLVLTSGPQPASGVRPSQRQPDAGRAPLTLDGLTQEQASKLTVKQVLSLAPAERGKCTVSFATPCQRSLPAFPSSSQRKHNNLQLHMVC